MNRGDVTDSQPTQPAAPVPAEGPIIDYAKPRQISAPRNRAIDVVRFFAAAGIVFVHAAKSEPFLRWGNVVRFAVPFYLFASLYFQSASLRKKNDRTFLQYVAGRFKRLYLPFLAWSVIYFLARNGQRLVTRRDGGVETDIGLLWRGVHYHLWFLPFLLFWSLVLAAVHYGILSRNRKFRWPLIITAIIAGVVFALIPRPSSWDEVFPSPTYAYVQYWLSLPAVLWALAFAWFMTAGPTLYTVPHSLGVAGLVLTAICCLWQGFVGHVRLIPRGLTGLGTILAALAPWNGTFLSPLAALGKNSYGVYLCHVLILETLRTVTKKLNIGVSPASDIGLFIATFVLSLIFVQILSKSSKTAWLNG